jgi:CheY-like chemotaxis protein
MSNHALNPIETLRLSAADKQKLIDYVEHTARQPVNNERRGLRVNYFGRKVLVTVTNQEGQKACCTVVPRNLSRRGLAFVHGRFVYPDSRAEVTLPMLNGKWCVLRGLVRRCRHVQGIVHEVSIVFDDAIDLAQFVRLTHEQSERQLAELAQDGLNEHDLAPGCWGRVLLVEDQPADRRLIKLWLQRMQLMVVDTCDVHDALETISRGLYDLFLIDGHLGEEDGVELIEHLRGQGILAPILALSASDESGTFGPRAQKAGATAVLPKPLNPDDLCKQIEQVMTLAGKRDESPLPSQLKQDPEMEPLIADFVTGLAVCMTKIRTTIAKSDLEPLSQLCGNLKGTGGSHGFPQLTEAAKLVMQFLDAKPRDLDKVRRGINELMFTIRRIQAAYA